MLVARPDDGVGRRKRVWSIDLISEICTAAPLSRWSEAEAAFADEVPYAIVVVELDEPAGQETLL